jgi:hypothetical protein
MTQRKSETFEEFQARKNAWQRNYRLRNLDRERARTRKWWSIPENRKLAIKKMMVYAKTKGRPARRELERRKQDTNLNYRIKRACAQRVRGAIKGLTKSASTIRLIGCDVDFLRLHLAAQFQDGMTWANWGEWHIDHRIPCAEFDLRYPEQQRKCFHYSNLRPLWMKENVTRYFKEKST